MCLRPILLVIQIVYNPVEDAPVRGGFARSFRHSVFATLGMYAVVHACCCVCMLLCMHAAFLCVCRLRHPWIDILGSDSFGSAPSGSNPSGSRRLRSPIGLSHSAPGRVDCSNPRSLHSPVLACLIVCMLSPALLCVLACSHGCDDSLMVLV